MKGNVNELALFSGGGGGILGGILLGWRTVCAVEIDPYCRSVLFARQRDGILPRFPIWDDIRTFDGKPWQRHVDIITGGFPCQDISAAGTGAGIAGKRSGLWSEMARIIGEVRPKFVLVENSPLLRTRGLGLVLLDLAKMGYDARWGIIGAHHAGAPHKRDRIWILANAKCSERRTVDIGNHSQGQYFLQQVGQESATRSGSGREALPDTAGVGCDQGRLGESDLAGSAGSGAWWSAEPDVGRMANGVANRLDRLKAIGNGQVPAVVRLSWEMLTENKDNE